MNKYRKTIKIKMNYLNLLLYYKKCETIEDDYYVNYNISKEYE